MTEPVLTVIMTTYDPGTGKRTPLATQTLEALRDKLVYSSLRWIIADDGSQGEHISLLKNILIGLDVHVTNAERRGVGHSKNIALQEAFTRSPYVLLLEDDWVLKERLEILPYMRILTERENIGMIRFGYLGGDMEAAYEQHNGVSFWRLKRGSGVYIYSGQVTLRHSRFYDVVGYHNVGSSPGEEELEMCKRFNATDSAPDIIWPANIPSTLNSGLFINVGMDHSVNAVQPETT